MLSTTNLDLAQKILSPLEGKLKFTVRPGTPLDEIMHVSLSGEGEDITSARSMAGLNVHDEILKKLVNLGNHYLQSSMYRARSVVVPLARQLTDDVNHEVNQRIHGVSEYTVERTKACALLDVPAFNQMIEGVIPDYSETLTKGMPFNSLPVIAFDEEFMDKLKVNIGTVDEAAKSEIDIDFVKYVWAVVPDGIRKNIDTHLQLHGDMFVVKAFYVLRAILLNTEALDIDVDDSIRVYIEAAVAFLRQRTTVVGSRRERAIQNQLLISFIDERTIHVNDDVYKLYLKQGGTVEALFGAAIRAKGVYLKEIIKDAEVNVTAYDQYLRHTQAQVKSLRAEAVRITLPKLLNRHISEDPELAERKVEYINSIRTCMNAVAINEADIYPAVRQLICTVLYGKTDTLKVLSRIDTLMANNPDMDQADAATACYTSLLVEFYMQQLIIEEC